MGLDRGSLDCALPGIRLGTLALGRRSRWPLAADPGALGCYAALTRLCAATSAIAPRLIVGRIGPFVGFACERRRTVLTLTLAKWRVRMPERAESVTAPEGSPGSASDHARAKRRDRWGWILAVAVACGGASFIWQRHALAQSKAQAPRARPPLAVTTATATQGDI